VHTDSVLGGPPLPALSVAVGHLMWVAHVSRGPLEPCGTSPFTQECCPDVWGDVLLSNIQETWTLPSQRHSAM
jgi:hypothetical protein